MSISDAKQTLMGALLPVDVRRAVQLLLDEWGRLETIAHQAQDLAGDGPVCSCCQTRAARIYGRCTNCAPAVDRALEENGRESISSQQARQRESAERLEAERISLSRIEQLRDLLKDILDVPYAVEDGREVHLARTWRAIRADIQEALNS